MSAVRRGQRRAACCGAVRVAPLVRAPLDGIQRCAVRQLRLPVAVGGRRGQRAHCHGPAAGGMTTLGGAALPDDLQAALLDALSDEAVLDLLGPSWSAMSPAARARYGPPTV